MISNEIYKGDTMRALILIPIIILLVYPAFALSQPTGPWAERIELLKEKYPGKMDYSHRRGIYVLSHCGKPFKPLPNNCLIWDFSTPKQKANTLNCIKSFNRRHGISKTSLLPLCGSAYLGAIKFIKLYDSNSAFRKMMPQGLKELMPQLRAAMQKGWLDGEGKYHGTFWSHTCEGYICLVIPTADVSKKLFAAYHFLLPIDATRKISDIVNAFKKKLSDVRSKRH